MLATTVRDIKSLKIQGAERIALAAVSEFSLILRQHRASPKLIQKLTAAHTALIAARPTEPFLRNCLNAILHGNHLTTAELQRRVNLVLQHIATADQHIIRATHPLFSPSTAVYTHCHSTTVSRILQDAAARRYRITVHSTETRPRFQGRITAAELAKAHIPVVQYVDSAMRLALKASDIALIGADAITADGKVVNKIGSELAAETAYRFGVPFYVCTNSWKFDPATVSGSEEPIEERSTAEVWSNAPRGIIVRNPAFERIHPRWIKGIISELGILSPKQFVREVQERYPLLAN